jgi:hypothetical protein
MLAFTEVSHCDSPHPYQLLVLVSHFETADRFNIEVCLVARTPTEHTCTSALKDRKPGITSVKAIPWCLENVRLVRKAFFWDVTPCGSCSCHPDDGGAKFLRNADS